MRAGKFAITGIAAAALVLTTPSTAWGAPKAQSPSTKVLTSAVVAPFNLAVDRHRLLVADGGTSTLSRIKADGTLKTIADGPRPGNVAGVAISRNGRSIAYTTTENPSDFVNANGSLHIRRAGGGTVSVNLATYETKKNPDQGVSYGVETTPKCAAEFEKVTGQPASYTGLNDSHPYSVTAYGKRSWIVADAGGNDLLKVNRNGRVSTIAVLPVQPLVLTADIVASLGLPECVTDLTYKFEAVPTDVEVGRDGYLYVTTLAGGPESPELGARSSVYRVNPHNGRVKLVATGLLGATNLALHRGKIYVSEFFAGQISVINRGKPKLYPRACPGSSRSSPVGATCTPAPSRAKRTVVRARWSRSARGGRSRSADGGQGAQGERITRDPEADDDAGRDGRDVGVVAEGLPPVHVRDVQLDHRDLRAGDRVVQRDAGVGVGAGVEAPRRRARRPAAPDPPPGSSPPVRPRDCSAESPESSRARSRRPGRTPRRRTRSPSRRRPVRAGRAG